MRRGTHEETEDMRVGTRTVTHLNQSHCDHRDETGVQYMYGTLHSATNTGVARLCGLEIFVLFYQ